ncbi:MAG: FixH family protein [Hydrogenophilaceae bacterium]|nr:FixH family protein [Hydrogenophilaceae bacterium]
MNQPLSSIPESNPPWWRQPWPWFLMALPLSAVVGGIITVWLAVNGADDLVSDDYYKEGLAIRQVVERDAKASQLGLMAELKAHAGALSVNLGGDLPADPDSLRLRLIHPTQAGQDIVLTLKAMGKQQFMAHLPAMPPGRRQLQLEPPDRSWRLIGEWRSPLDGQLTLQARP